MSESDQTGGRHPVFYEMAGVDPAEMGEMTLDLDSGTNLHEAYAKLHKVGEPGGADRRQIRDMANYEIKVNQLTTKFFLPNAFDYQQNPPQDYQKLPDGYALILQRINNASEEDFSVEVSFGKINDGHHSPVNPTEEVLASPPTFTLARKKFSGFSPAPFVLHFDDKDARFTDPASVEARRQIFIAPSLVDTMIRSEGNTPSVGMVLPHSLSQLGFDVVKGQGPFKREQLQSSP